MKRILSLLLIAVLLTATLLSFSSCSGDKETPPPSDMIYTVEMVVKNYGTVTIELHSEYAPYTVANFVRLVRAGFYDGLTFHRVISGFMIQGGDPLGNGTGGSDKDIVGEFALNGRPNSLLHKRGVISMARSGAGSVESLLSQLGCNVNNFREDPVAMQMLAYYSLDADEVYEAVSSACNSASSQFFIVHRDTESLDGNYAAFGYVTEGMEVVDAIAAVSVDSSDKPLIPVTISSITLVSERHISDGK